MQVKSYNRDDLWSTGILTKDVIQISKNIEAIKQNQLEQILKKLGDIAGCPIPDIVAKRVGQKNAFKYLFSLVEDYNIIRDYLIKKNISWSNQWGKQEKRREDQPASEYSTRIPKGIIDSNTIRGPGKYHEFSITRLLWALKFDSEIQFKTAELYQIIDQSNSVIDFHVNIIILAATKLNFSNNANIAVATLVLGIAHEGYLKQNNCFYEIRITLKLLAKKAKAESWYHPIENQVNTVVSQIQ
jgi:hypothetical protein